MYLITARMRRADSMAVESIDRIRAVVENTAFPSERLEHVYVKTEGPHIGIVLFLVSPDLAAAEFIATALINRATRGGLRGWALVTCEAELITTFSEAALEPDD